MFEVSGSSDLPCLGFGAISGDGDDDMESLFAVSSNAEYR